MRRSRVVRLKCDPVMFLDSRVAWDGATLHPSQLISQRHPSSERHGHVDRRILIFGRNVDDHSVDIGVDNEIEIEIEIDIHLPTKNKLYKTTPPDTLHPRESSSPRPPASHTESSRVKAAVLRRASCALAAQALFFSSSLCVRRYTASNRQIWRLSGMPSIAR